MSNKSNKPDKTYVPLSMDTISKGDKFGPIKFSVKRSIYEKTMLHLKNSYFYEQKINDNSILLPSDIWGAARVLSSAQAGYGQINEALIRRSNWRIYGCGFAEEELFAETEIMNIKMINNIPSAQFKTVTRNRKGRVLLESIDELLLLHRVKFDYKENYTELKKNDYNYHQKVKGTFRHNVWEDWANNIHNDKFGKEHGFKQGILEFPTYINWIFQSLDASKKYKLFEINLKNILPIYNNDILNIYGRDISPSMSEVYGCLDSNNAIRFSARVKYL